MDHHTSWFSFMPGYQALHERLNAAYGNYVYLPVGGHTYETVHHIYAAVLVVLLLAVLAIVARMRLSRLDDVIIPSKSMSPLTFFELILELLSGMMQNVIGKEYKRYVPMIGTLALFILISNLLGLVPGFVPPTDNLNTTAACAVTVFVWFNFHGIRTHGLAHITHLANPLGVWWGWFLSPLMFPVEVFGLLVRPVTLALRLAANMIGDHRVLFAFAAMMPILLPLPFYALGLLVCLIQTAVFCILSTVYIALHTQEEEH